MENNITNKVIVITGASSGLGEETAKYLAKKGAMVVLGARREDRLEKIVSEITSEGGKAVYKATDVTVKSQVQALIDLALSTYNRIDVVINNAGIMPIAPISEVRTDEWDQMIDINIKGVLYGIAAALPIFQEQQSGHFINLGSVAGIKVFSPGGTVYSGTKYAVRAITDGLRHEIGGNIRATTIEPGAVDSELKFSTNHEESSKGVKEFYQIAIPAASVARAIAFAIEQPADVDINEIVMRPTQQEF
ncbi:SDR family oxidoreductase [Muricauda oceani]|uniref:SDR family oxidoreductase n=1 Tax=Flagellimonas oceani TaxID=2698672 RepID=A0A6G7J0G5_9FLAO|nr:SDR family oxidoreductase [Allomuricauda oceani]MBW8243646.1 SDR family oxidoreductase [Allomuricauda oceani]QII43987.1 SDR family oxidoreductase [Allomuricauda oceani]